VICPVGAGLPGIGGKDPGSIAIGVAAEILATKAARARPHSALFAATTR
jgi:xanthine/CO dehydrogenase XdhC/CoxF family maturation factor